MENKSVRHGPFLLREFSLTSEHEHPQVPPRLTTLPSRYHCCIPPFFQRVRGDLLLCIAASPL